MRYRYALLPYSGPSSRKTCPSCGDKREFAPYIDNVTRELLPDHVGRCNNELKCGYHYSAKQFFEDKGSFQPLKRINMPEPVKPTNYLPIEILEKSLSSYSKNNFFLFLCKLFGEVAALDLYKRYLIGTSKHWPGANIFWQIDNKERIRTGKIMHYSPITGKRTRDRFDHINWVHKVLKMADFNYKQCFFGEHLLSEFPNHEVCIVESEKTAIISSVYFPQFIWIATGGKAGCRWFDKEVSRVLIDRIVTLYPDSDAFEVWKQKADVLSKNIRCELTVSDYLEKTLPIEQKKKGIDIADILLTTCASSGIALIEPGYPIAFDYQVNKEWCNGVALVQ
jgi:hypothetical protein